MSIKKQRRRELKEGLSHLDQKVNVLIDQGYEKKFECFVGEIVTQILKPGYGEKHTKYYLKQFLRFYCAINDEVMVLMSGELKSAYHKSEYKDNKHNRGRHDSYYKYKLSMISIDGINWEICRYTNDFSNDDWLDSVTDCISLDAISEKLERLLKALRKTSVVLMEAAKTANKGATVKFILDDKEEMIKVDSLDSELSFELDRQCLENFEDRSYSLSGEITYPDDDDGENVIFSKSNKSQSRKRSIEVNDSEDEQSRDLREEPDFSTKEESLREIKRKYGKFSSDSDYDSDDDSKPLSSVDKVPKVSASITGSTVKECKTICPEVSIYYDGVIIPDHSNLTIEINVKNPYLSVEKMERGAFTTGKKAIVVSIQILTCEAFSGKKQPFEMPTHLLLNEIFSQLWLQYSIVIPWLPISLYYKSTTSCKSCKSRKSSRISSGKVKIEDTFDINLALSSNCEHSEPYKHNLYAVCDNSSLYHLFSHQVAEYFFPQGRGEMFSEKSTGRHSHSPQDGLSTETYGFFITLLHRFCNFIRAYSTRTPEDVLVEPMNGNDDVELNLDNLHSFHHGKMVLSMTDILIKCMKCHALPSITISNCFVDGQTLAALMLRCVTLRASSCVSFECLIDCANVLSCFRKEQVEVILSPSIPHLRSLQLQHTGSTMTRLPVSFKLNLDYIQEHLRNSTLPWVNFCCEVIPYFASLSILDVSFSFHSEDEARVICFGILCGIVARKELLLNDLKEIIVKGLQSCYHVVYKEFESLHKTIGSTSIVTCDGYHISI